MKQILYNLYEFPRHLFDWARLWIHCMYKFSSNFKGEDHRMCKTITHNSDKSVSEKFYFCTCEYLVDEMPKEYQEYATLINKLGKDMFK